MPKNYTFDKVREMLTGIKVADPQTLKESIEAAQWHEIKGALTAAIFVSHHLAGDHDVSVDRLITDEETGERYAVISHAEGELPIKMAKNARGVRAGSTLRYEAADGGYKLVRRSIIRRRSSR